MFLSLAKKPIMFTQIDFLITNENCNRYMRGLLGGKGHLKDATVAEILGEKNPAVFFCCSKFYFPDSLDLEQ
jgi:hypothetical protein